MKTQAKLIYGESLSPIRAHFQKMPITLETAVLVHCTRQIETRSDAQLIPSFVSIEDGGEYLVDVCCRADKEKYNEEKGLEVEEGRLANKLASSNVLRDGGAE